MIDGEILSVIERLRWREVASASPLHFFTSSRQEDLNLKCDQWRSHKQRGTHFRLNVPVRSSSSTCRLCKRNNLQLRLTMQTPPLCSAVLGLVEMVREDPFDQSADYDFPVGVHGILGHTAWNESEKTRFVKSKWENPSTKWDMSKQVAEQTFCPQQHFIYILQNIF